MQVTIEVQNVLIFVGWKDMNAHIKVKLKQIAFVLLGITCIVAALFLFWPESTKRKEAPDSPELVETIRSAVPKQPAPPQTNQEEAVSAKTEWNTYHGDTALTGTVDTHFSSVLERSWQILLGDPVEEAPVAVDDRIFVVTPRARVVALSLEGEILWDRVLQSHDDTSSQSLYTEAPIACFASMLFVATDDGQLTALDVESGDLRWRTDLDGYAHGTINYHEASQSVFVLEQGSGDLLCMESDTGTLRWRSKGKDRADGSPSVSGDKVVFGSCASALHVVAVKDGSYLHDIKIEEGGGQVAGGVAIQGEFVYAGCRDGRVMRANLQEGVMDWIHSVSKTEVFSTPALQGDLLLISALDGVLHGLKQDTGERVWQHVLGGETGSPVIVDDKVVIVSDDSLFLLALEDGTRLWESQLAGYLSGPAIAGNMIVVGCEDGTVTAFVAASTEEKEAVS